jgi:hypothetical protein
MGATWANGIPTGIERTESRQRIQAAAIKVQANAERTATTGLNMQTMGHEGVILRS